MAAKNKTYSSLLLMVGLLLSAYAAHATPTLQVYIEGATAADSASPIEDNDTWVLSTSPSTPVVVDLMANFGSNVTAIDNAYLVITVPQGDDLALSWEYPLGSGYTALDLTPYYYDDNDAFEAALGATFNNHSPYGAAASLVDVYAIPLNVLQAGMGTFSPITAGIPDCNADIPGTTTCATGNPNKKGEIKRVGLLMDNADGAHFDMVAQVTTANGANTWQINPGSHDSTWRKIPEPATVLLLGLGLLGIYMARRRKGRLI